MDFFQLGKVPTIWTSQRQELVPICIYMRNIRIYMRNTYITIKHNTTYPTIWTSEWKKKAPSWHVSNLHMYKYVSQTCIKNMYMYICMYICTYKCIRMCTYMYTYTFMSIYMYVCVHVCVDDLHQCPNHVGLSAPEWTQSFFWTTE